MCRASECEWVPRARNQVQVFQLYTTHRDRVQRLLRQVVEVAQIQSLQVRARLRDSLYTSVCVSVRVTVQAKRRVDMYFDRAVVKLYTFGEIQETQGRKIGVGFIGKTVLGQHHTVAKAQLLQQVARQQYITNRLLFQERNTHTPTHTLTHTVTEQ